MISSTQEQPTVKLETTKGPQPTPLQSILEKTDFCTMLVEGTETSLNEDQLVLLRSRSRWDIYPDSEVVLALW
ncbi:hypothetical protein DBR06_SOUSAS4910031 [Sousa chinensis]|nr:hypothetical protein DBR06_SOUSAS4910031 [Sousa chinensis]